MKWVVAAYFLTWGFIPWILLAQKRPVSTLAWIWAVVLFPFAGPIGFLLFGVDRITRPRRRQQARAKPSADAAPEPSPCLEERDIPLFRALSVLSGFPTSTAGEPRLLPNASAFYPALRESIARAKHHAHVQFFVWESDEYGRELRDVLVAAAQRGVVVRVLMDRVGSLHTNQDFFEPLLEAGGQLAWFRTLNPLRRHFALHLRNHRKLQILDGEIAYVGGMNIGRNYDGKNVRIGKWRDLQMELRGPIVSELQRVFADDWYFSTEQEIEGDGYFSATGGPAAPHAAQVVLGGPDLPIEAMADSLMVLLHHASRRAWIATGYFIPNSLLLSALRLAAARGVDVRLLGSEKSDHPYFAEIGRSYYEQLLRSGVRIFEYSGGFHHAKAMLLDDDLVMIGSANCDNRSLRLNFELNVLVECRAAARGLEAEFRSDFDESREITLEQFLTRPLARRLVEAMVRPLSPMV